MIIVGVFLLILGAYIFVSAIWWSLFQGNAEPISFLEALGWLPLAILAIMRELFYGEQTEEERD